MKYLKILMAIAICSIYSTIYAQQKNGFHINGKIAGLKEGEKVILTVFTPVGDPLLDRFDFVKCDSSLVKNTEFEFKGYVSEGPRDYMIYFPEHYKRNIQFALANNENVSIKCEQVIDNINHTFIKHFMTIDGSPSYNAGNSVALGIGMYREVRGQLINRIQKIYDSVGFNTTILDPLFQLKNTLDQCIYRSVFRVPEPDYLPAIPGAAMAAFEDSGRARFWKTVYDSLDNSLKQTISGKQLGEKVKLSVGQPMPEFSLPDVSGKITNLKDVYLKNKLTIVQFWASNSVEVDKYQEELKVLYSKYHNKGLDIVGVSADILPNKWKAGILKNELPWLQVSDLKGGHDGIIGKVYKEYADPKIPNTTNVLLDNQGKILAWDINGPELQWMLWKNLGN